MLATKDGPVETLEPQGLLPTRSAGDCGAGGRAIRLRTPSKILSADELNGRESFDPTPDAVAALDWVWEQVDRAGMTDGKNKPPIHCFRKVMNGGVVVRGFLRDGIVYVNEDLATGTSVDLAANRAGRDGPLSD